MPARPVTKHRLLRSVVAIVAVPFAYVLSYFLLCTHRSEESFIAGHPRTGVYTYHDRNYDFDPWIYSPLAKLECKLRRGRTQVVLDGSPGRDGSAIYIFWSEKPED
jgi:hypothetical protein